MSEVTAPIMTDATGQSIDGKLNSLLGKMDNLAAAFQPNASGIVYSNTTSGLTGDDVQEAIDEMAADVSEINQSLSDIEDVIDQIDGITIYKQILNQDIVSFSAESSMPIMKLVSNISNVSGCTEANVSVVGKNLLASSTLVSNTYINQNTGEEIPYNGWTSTDYIPINRNKWYRLLKLVDGSYEVNAGATVYWACYDSNLNFVIGSVGDGMKNFPSNAKWLRTSSQTALMNKAVLCEDSDISSFTTESDYIDGNSYNVPFVIGGSTITIYNGTYDLISGVLIDNDNSTTYQLPATPINDLQGDNNIWSDTGSIANVAYLDILNIS